jgi:hypothetical protein
VTDDPKDQLNSESQPKTPRPGFTLREVVIVILIMCPILGFLAWKAQEARDAAEGSVCHSHAYQWAFWLTNYHEATGHFPPPVIRDAQGRAMHSWRTEVLRIVNQGENVRGYNFDEPWNSQQNLLFAKQNTNWVHCPSDSTESNTSYVLLIGKNCLFKDETYEPTLAEITGTVPLVVEVSDSGILWTEPRDAHCDSPVCGTACDGVAAFSIVHPQGRRVVTVNREGKLKSRSE